MALHLHLHLHRALARLVALVVVATTLTLGIAVAAPVATAASTTTSTPTSTPTEGPDEAPIHGLAADAAATSVISGLVYDEDGELVDDILVEAYSATGTTDAPVASALTYEAGPASHGAYELHVPAGDFKVRLSSPDTAYDGVIETLWYGDGATVTVGLDQTLQLDDVTVYRDSGAPVTGRVVDAAGKPMVGVEVSLYGRKGGDAYSVDESYTDAQGGFTFTGVNRGRAYTVGADGTWTNRYDDYLGWPSGYLGGAPAAGLADTFTLAPGSTGQVLADLVLRPGTQVSGTVTGPEGQPVSSGAVYFYAQGPDGSWSHLRGGYFEGTYAQQLLPGFTYTVGVYPHGEFTGYETFLGDTDDLADATPFTFPAGAPTFTVAPVRVGLRTGSATVQVLDADGDQADSDNVAVTAWTRDESGEWSETIDATGGYGDPWSVRLRYGRTHTFAAYDYDTDQRTFLGGGSTPEGATTVTVTETSPTVDAGTITLTAPTRKIRGVVLGPDGGPVAGAEVQVWGQYAADCADCYEPVVSTRTGRDGRYAARVRDWWAGDYTRLTVSAEGGTGLGRTFLGQTDAVEDASTFELPTATATLDAITLAYAPGVVTGTITTEDGADVSQGSTYVDLYRWSAEDGYFEYSDYAYARGTAYAFTDVPDGTYAVRATTSPQDGESPYLASWRGGARPDSVDDPGVFTVGSEVNPTAGIDIELVRGVLVSGVVTTATGSPLADTYLNLYTWGQGGTTQYLNSTVTDPTGHYQVQVPKNVDLFLYASRAGFAPHFLGGGASWPWAQTADNTLAVGVTGAVHDFAMTSVWGPVGKVAGQRHDYCFARTGSSPRLGDLALTWSWDGTISRAGGSSPDAFDPLNREPFLAPLKGDSYWGRSWGVSPDGTTLCLQESSSSYTDSTTGEVIADGPVHQVLLTESPQGGLDVTYNYDAVPYADGGERAGWDEGNSSYGDTTLLPGFEDGGYADGAATGLIHHSVGSDVPGRYRFHFDGFEPRGEAPEPQRWPSIAGTPAVGAPLTLDAGAWTVGGVESPDLELLPTWIVGRRQVATGSTFVVRPEDAGRRVRVEIRAWAPGHEQATYSSPRLRIPAGDPVAANMVAPVVTPSAPAIGDTLSVERGDWTPAAGLTADDLTWSYAWFRNGNRINAQTGPTYVVREGDALDDLSVEVTAGRSGYAAVTAASAPVTVADKPQLAWAAAPTLGGIAQVGSPLTLTTGTFPDGVVPTVTVSWKVGYYSRSADSGTGGLRLTPAAGDTHEYVTATVEATAPGHRRATWSTTTSPVAAADAQVATLNVHVQGSGSGAPVTGAYVYACEYVTYTCLPGGDVDANGDFSGSAISGATYHVYVYPYGEGFRQGELTYTMPATGPGTAVVRLTEPTPPPPNVSIPTSTGTYDGLPVVYWQQDQTFEVSGCAATLAPSYTVTFSDGTAPTTGTMAPQGTATGGIVTFSAVIPAFYPAHGDTEISTNIPATCAPGSAPTTVHVYIDPSGVVTDQYGRAIEGATVTLQRSEGAGGPFVAVPDGSDVMSEDNRQNPDATDATGFFRWDVTEGWYRVKVEKPGCTTTTTEPMQVLPARVDLLIKLTCITPPPSTVPTITGTPKVGATLETSTAAWAPVFTVARQWLRDGAPIPGATGAGYVLTPADLGTTISVRHTATRPSYAQEEGRGAPVTFTDVPATSVGQLVVPGDAATAAAPVLAGSGKVGTTLSTTAPTWSLSGVTDTRQWYRGTTPITDATGTTYQVTPADVGQPLTVRHTGTRTGYSDATTTTNAVTAQPGDAATASAAPAVSGTAVVGGTLTASTGTWTATGLSHSYQWLRAGVPVAGATGSSYQLSTADAGRAISVVVTASRAGHASASSTSPATTVAKLVSGTTLKPTKKKLKAGQKAVLVVTVAASGIASPAGQVLVYDGKKQVGVGVLSATGKGLVTVTLKKLKPGAHKLSALYVGDDTVSGSRSATTKLVIKKKKKSKKK